MCPSASSLRVVLTTLIEILTEIMVSATPPGFIVSCRKYINLSTTRSRIALALAPINVVGGISSTPRILIASLKMILADLMGRFMRMIRRVVVEFAGQSVYATMILRSRNSQQPPHPFDSDILPQKILGGGSEQ